MRRQAALLACLVLPLFLVPGWSTQADGKAPVFGQAQILLDNQPAPPASLAVTGFALAARTTGPQVALMQRPGALLFGLGGAEEAAITIPVRGLEGAFTVTAQATVLGEGKAEATLTVDGSTTRKTLDAATGARIETAGEATVRGNLVRLGVRSQGGTPAVRWRDIRLVQGGRSWDIVVKPSQTDPNRVPPPILPPLRPALEQALIEWDWRMQDGIGTERQPSSYAEATARTLQRGDALLRDLAAGDVSLVEEQRQWHQLRQRHEEQARAKGVSEHAQEQLWLQVHSLRRRIALRNPLAQTGSIVFAKQVPGSFSHQLTQYLGRFARPGGGLFVLEEPGQSMKCRQLVADALPEGSYQHPDVSHDGKRVLFSYCQVAATARSWNAHSHLHYHLYEIGADGSGLKQLTEGDFNDFSPRYLPNGQLVFISTRRGGWHRCGGRPGEGCENHTLALANADGSSPRPISFHETQEWDPSVLDDGRILYTRWDYVDRHAVFYQQLFTCRADGSATATFYGNNTFNPVGTWEARQVPGSRRVMATAGAHHAMTAGSIILVDPSRGVDGPAPLTRLTPDALFPESETRIPPAGWHAPVGVARPPTVPVQAQRWPGHCYRSPYPLSDKYFLAAYSFDQLLGEPAANPVNMFGLYLVDAFGNKELLYRDLNIASLYPLPLRPRPRPPLHHPTARHAGAQEGLFYIQNVFVSDPPLPKDAIKALRILQVVPKSTPGINWPRVGIANASPGKQVLGTVPVAADGSAYFRAPAGIPLTFQVLDEHGQAVQMMRSVTYLQPGEVQSCVGCHDRRTAAPPPTQVGQALKRPPAVIKPGPDGSRPLSYPILVQPVLDRHCVSCHQPKKAEGKIVLTGEPQGAFSVSYNALAPRVAFTAWGNRPGDFRIVNSEPRTMPNHFGARGSELMKMLSKGHHGVKLSAEDRERLITWMDANAMFYGTFEHSDQARQRRGERIGGLKHQ